MDEDLKEEVQGDSIHRPSDEIVHAAEWAVS